MTSRSNPPQHPCDLLNIPRDSSIAVARKARIELSKKAHPDKGEASPEIYDLYLRVNAYFKEWEDATRAGREFIPKAEPVEEEDPFADLVAKKDELKTQARSKYKAKNGADIRISRKIDIEKAIAEGKINITVTTELRSSAFANQSKFQLNIPSHFLSGNTLKLSGKGQPGLFGGISGDLFITLNSNKAAPKPSPSPTPPKPSPSPTPPKPKSEPESEAFSRNEITQIQDLGDKSWWKLGVAGILIFIVVKMFSGSGTSEPVPIDYDQETTQSTDSGEVIDEIPAEESTIEDPETTNVSPENSETGATGEVDSEVSENPDEAANNLDSGATGSLQ